MGSTQGDFLDKAHVKVDNFAVQEMYIKARLEKLSEVLYLYNVSVDHLIKEFYLLLRFLDFSFFMNLV